MTRKKQKQEHNSSTILQSVFVMTASLCNVAFNICEKHEIQTLSPFSSERRGGWRASAPLSAAAAAALLCFTPSVYIKCHSHSHAPSITPNSKRLRPPAALPRRPDGRGSPSPRRVLHPRPFVFQNRRTFLPQKAQRYTTANHFIISNTLPLLRISQSDAFYYGNHRRCECRAAERRWPRLIV